MVEICAGQAILNHVDDILLQLFVALSVKVTVSQVILASKDFVD